MTAITNTMMSTLTAVLKLLLDETAEGPPARGIVGPVLLGSTELGMGAIGSDGGSGTGDVGGVEGGISSDIPSVDGPGVVSGVTVDGGVACSLPLYELPSGSAAEVPVLCPP